MVEINPEYQQMIDHAEDAYNYYLYCSFEKQKQLQDKEETNWQKSIVCAIKRHVIKSINIKNIYTLFDNKFHYNFISQKIEFYRVQYFYYIINNYHKKIGLLKTNSQIQPDGTTIIVLSGNSFCYKNGEFVEFYN